MSKFFKISKVLGRQVPKAVGDPGLIMRSKVFRRSLKVDHFQNLIIQGFRASRVIGFQDMWGYIFNVSPGHRVPLASWGFRDVLAFPKSKGFRENI